MVGIEEEPKGGSNPILSIIIPALNEEETIGNLLDRIRKTFEHSIEKIEVIVVDDGSIDSTGKIAESKMAKIIRNKTNLGYGAALKAGLFQARGKYLAFIDADNTYSPESMPLMLKEAKKGYFVVGSRFLGGNNNMSLIRKFGNVFFAMLAILFTGKCITDVGSGLRIFNRSFLKGLKDLPNGLDFTPAMTLKVILYDFPYKEIPIWYGRRLGKSKLNVFLDGWKFLKAIVVTFATHRCHKSNELLLTVK